MRRLALTLLATTSLVAITQSATAADLRARPVTKAPAAVVPAYYSWNGCYVGGHVGWGWGRKDVPSATVFIPSVLTSDYDGFRTDVDGFLGGVQGGCNYQVNPKWVIGFEGQFSWADIEGDHTSDPFLFGKTGAATFTARVDWLATLAARVGYTWDRWLLYGKGGIAWARDKYSIVGCIESEGCSPFNLVASGRETRTGWMLGVGLEYAFQNYWSAKLEYNYLDFGRDRVTLSGVFDGSTPFSVSTDIDQQIHVVKFGVNYRWPVGGRW